MLFISCYYHSVYIYTCIYILYNIYKLRVDVVYLTQLKEIIVFTEIKKLNKIIIIKIIKNIVVVVVVVVVVVE